MDPKQKLISNFNTVVSNLAEDIAMINPGSMIANNKKVIHNIVTSNPVKLLDLFIIYVLPDKHYIDAGDEQYFLGKTYSDLTTDSDSIKLVFEFHKFWHALTPGNKHAIIQCMRVLCKIATSYFALIE